MVIEGAHQVISAATLKRLPGYLIYLKSKQYMGMTNISSAYIAQEMVLNPVQVRKDLAAASSGGKPKTGFAINELIDELEKFLGYDNNVDAILVGVGQLGQTLLSYNGFSTYGLNIVAGFDLDAKLIGSKINDKQILPLDKFKNLVERLKVRIGIITVPAAEAQYVCNLMVDSGIKAIWNFAPAHLIIPEDVIIQNENLAASLALLSKKLSAQTFTNGGDK